MPFLKTKLKSFNIFLNKIVYFFLIQKKKGEIDVLLRSQENSINCKSVFEIYVTSIYKLYELK